MNAKNAPQRRTEATESGAELAPPSIVQRDTRTAARIRSPRKLSPCPKCGAAAHLYCIPQAWTGRPLYYVACSKCGSKCSGMTPGKDPFGNVTTTKEAITAAINQWEAGKLYSREAIEREFAAWIPAADGGTDGGPDPARP